MPCTVRSLRDDELLVYLEIVNASIAGFAVHHYTSEAIQGWLVPAATLGDLSVNADALQCPLAGTQLEVDLA